MLYRTRYLICLIYNNTNSKAIYTTLQYITFHTPFIPTVTNGASTKSFKSSECELSKVRFQKLFKSISMCEFLEIGWEGIPCLVNVNVTDTILWQGHHDRVMQLNWLYFCGICQMMPLKVWPNTALGCNHQSICMPQLQPLCSAALVPNVLPRRDEGSGQPCAVIEAL